MSEGFQNPPANPLLRRRRSPVAKPIAYGLIVVLFGGLIAVGTFFLSAAFCSDTPLLWRLALLGVAAAALFLPARSGWLVIRRRWTTGRWSPSEQEIARNRAKWIGPQPTWARYLPRWLRNKGTSAFAFDLDALFALFFIPLAMLWIGIDVHTLLHHRRLDQTAIIQTILWVWLGAGSCRKVVRSLRRQSDEAPPKV